MAGRLHVPSHAQADLPGHARRGQGRVLSMLIMDSTAAKGGKRSQGTPAAQLTRATSAASAGKSMIPGRLYLWATLLEGRSYTISRTRCDKSRIASSLRLALGFGAHCSSP